MELIKQDMLAAREGHFVYQIQSENCAEWAQKIIEKVIGVSRVPNLFQMPFLESEPEGVMKVIFALVKSLPKGWQIPVTAFCHLPLGATCGRWVYEHNKLVWKSLTYHRFWKDTIVYHPSLLHKQQETGILGHYVPAGITAIVTRGITKFLVPSRLISIIKVQWIDDFCAVINKMISLNIKDFSLIPKSRKFTLRLVQ